ANALHVRVRDDFEVAPAQNRPQKGARSAPAHPAALVDLEVRVAEIVAAIELLDLRDAALRRGLTPSVQDLPAHAPLLDAHFSASAVQRIATVCVVLGAFEIRQHLVPGPALVAQFRPV